MNLASGKITMYKASKETILFASIFLYAMQYFLSISSIDWTVTALPCKLLLYMSMLLCMAYIVLHFSSKTKLKDSITFAIIAVLAVYIYKNIDYSIFLMFFMYLIAAKYSTPKRLLKNIYISAVFMLISLWALAMMGVIENSQKWAGRYGLGLNNYNIGFYFFNLCGIFIFLNAKRLKNKHFVVMMIINIYIYLMTKTKLSFACICLLLLLAYLVWKKKDRFIKCKVWYPVFGVAAVVEFVLTLYYKNLGVINTILNNRLRQQYRVYNEVGLSLFPRKIEYYVQPRPNGITYFFYIDSGYMDQIVRFGLCIAAVVVAAYTYALIKSINKKDLMLIVWILCVAVFNFVNNSFMNIFLDSSILLIWELRGKNNGNINQES